MVFRLELTVCRILLYNRFVSFAFTKVGMFPNAVEVEKLTETLNIQFLRHLLYAALFIFCASLT